MNNIEKVLNLTKYDLQASCLEYNGNSIHINNGYVFCYIDFDTSLKILRISNDKNIICKYVTEKNMSDCYKPYITNNAVYHLYNKMNEKPRILIDDYNLVRITDITLANFNKIFRLCYFHNSILTICSIGHEMVLSRIAENGLIYWNYSTSINLMSSINILGNDKIIVGIVDKNGKQNGYHIININGNLEKVIHIKNEGNYSNYQKPIMNNELDKLLFYSYIHNQEEVLTRAIIVNNNGTIYKNIEIEKICRIFLLFNEKYIYFVTDILSNKCICRFNYIDNIIEARIMIDPESSPYVLIYKIIKQDNNIVVISIYEGYFRITCYNETFLVIWSHKFQNELIDADFFDNYIYYLTNDNIAIYKIL